MRNTSICPRGLLEAALLLGALAFIADSVLGWAKVRRERRQYSEALHTWEGEGGAPDDAQPASAAPSTARERRAGP